MRPCPLSPPPRPASSAAGYLLTFVNGGQWGHLTVLVGTEDLAEGAGGDFTAQAVDVDLLVLMLLTHEVLLSLGVQWPGGERAERQEGQVPGWGDNDASSHEPLLFSLHQPPPPALPLQPQGSSRKEQRSPRSKGSFYSRGQGSPTGQEGKSFLLSGPSPLIATCGGRLSPSPSFPGCVPGSALYFYLFIFCLFTAAPAAYGSSQARGRIRATAAGHCHSHSHARSLTH